MRIPTWTPGMTLLKGVYDNSGRGPPGRTEGDFQNDNIRTLGLALGIPLFFIILICSSCCYCCCASSKKKKRQGEDSNLAVEEAADQHQDRTNGTETDPPPKYSPREGENSTSSFGLETRRVDRL